MDLANYQQKLVERKKDIVPGIHSYLHMLVKEICDYFKVKEFGRWLGVGKRIGVHNLKANFDYCKERGIDKVNYLAVMCKNK